MAAQHSPWRPRVTLRLVLPIVALLAISLVVKPCDAALRTSALLRDPTAPDVARASEPAAAAAPAPAAARPAAPAAAAAAAVSGYSVLGGVQHVNLLHLVPQLLGLREQKPLAGADAFGSSDGLGLLGGGDASGGGGGGKQTPHKNLFPLDWTDIAMLALTLITLILAAGGGIGGGAIYMPLFCALGGFNSSQAVALSNVTIVGGAMANFIINVQRRHPLVSTAPLIDWALILIMEPTTILGAVIGTYANKVLPSVATVSLMTILLSLLTINLWRRAISMHTAETRAFQALAAEAAANPSAANGGLREPLLGPSGRAGGSDAPAPAAGRANGAGDSAPGSLHLPSALAEAASADDASGAGSRSADVDITISAEPNGANSAAADIKAAAAAAGVTSSVTEGGKVTLDEVNYDDADEDAPTLVIARAERSGAAGGPRVVLPAVPLIVLLLLSVAVAASDEAKAYVQCGTWRYWLIVLAVIPPSIAVMLLTRRHLLRRAAQVASGGSRVLSRQFQSFTGGVGGVNIKYNAKNTLTYPAVCTLAGVIAGMFGLGGGVIKAPLMLELGVLPEVATATSTTMILFTASSACIVYSSFGLILYDYAAALLLLGMIGSAIGQVGVNRLVRYLGRRSLIIFTMASLMLLASVVSALQAYGNWEAVLLKGLSSLHWGNICAAGGDV